MPREVSTLKAVQGCLLSKGAEIEAAGNAEALGVAIATDATVVRRVARTGWRDDNRAFVSHRFVAPEAAESTLLSPNCPLVGAAGQLQVCGTLGGWRKLVGVARHSTAMTVALCATFAAPLLALLHRPSFALVFFGPSKVGKSFTQLVAASAMGFGREKELPTLNATRPGLQAAALAFNDLMLPINEIGTAQGRKRDIYDVLRETTYALLSGQDTIRHPSWSGAGSGAGTFNVIALFSSEIAPDAWAARNGETRDDGEMARLIGVPVLASGYATIFDRPPAELSGDALAEWEKARFKRMHRELPNQRGVALREYLNHLLGDVERVQARAQALGAHFEEQIATPSMSPVARDIVAKFGVLFAGGLLAVDAGVLPLDKKAVGRAVCRACRAALKELPDPQAELRADLANLQEHLLSGAVMNLETSNRQQVRLIRNAEGFRRLREGGTGEEFIVRAQNFTGWFGTPMRVRRLLEWLDDQGFLDHGRDRTTKRSNEWAQRQVTWPDGTRVRSVSLYAPHGVADFDVNA